MRRILLNVGNTNCQVAEVLNCANRLGLSDSVHVVSTSVVLREGTDADIESPLAQLLPKGEDWCALCACVVPAVRLILEKFWPGRFHFVSWRDYPFMDFSRYDAERLGADRVANAAAAFSLTRGPVMVIDCGTAITTEAVDGKGHFLGGLIFPGRMLARKALNTGTAQLPLIGLDETMPPPIGHCPEEAMKAGIDRTLAAGIAKAVEDVRQMSGMEKCRVMVAGGDAKFFLNALSDLEPAPHHLTLQGIALAAD